eukprot:TRINITY_DN4397_c0_g1_i1.p1 TRINITY_DN4397_c0_g1~~TRINITY_DN4397_c0_g1_i1.p1  ORF type:complete len:189 (-),score=59.48 TRINITY_DN4397_c0_g1_i1:78-644(-)
MNIDYNKIRNVLALDKTEEARKQRIKLWNQFDVNGNNILSLAEVDKGVRDALNLPELFKVKPVIMRAFQAAKNAVKNTEKKSNDEYIEKSEFRILLCYLRQYFELYDMFSVINSDGDKFIDYNEFVAGLPKLKVWGFNVTDPRKTFDEIDLDKGGKIRFDEFCHFAIKHNLDIDTDDDFQDESFKILN